MPAPRYAEVIVSYGVVAGDRIIVAVLARDAAGSREARAVAVRSLGGRIVEVAVAVAGLSFLASLLG